MKEPVLIEFDLEDGSITLRDENEDVIRVVFDTDNKTYNRLFSMVRAVFEENKDLTNETEKDMLKK